ncbi:chemotaxis protein [Acinetobacter sp. ANC 4648]|uniref:chemotaxis protein n=1 Tax=Acinetobacter sp. ANC 4648 TaxID=1977875 RepID=UPI000A352369|nr:chemotaxis protein [Acinetobacter sp. ANC 4648]OTG81705.1 chemotaxis protein [Acinetobacter sp. ANC 4648]
MSYQTSIHFDPTALLIIKKEVDNSIQQVESVVSSLVEDQTLPFGIEDALAQFEQCAHVLMLIDMPYLAQIAEYSAQLMRKIMQDPQQLHIPDVIALSEGTTMLKRYIEFSCLREVKVPQFLHDTLNRLELSLDKPLTQDGQAIVPLLDCVSPSFNLPQAPELEKSIYIHKLYKICLNKLLKQAETEFDLQGFKLVGTYLANLSTGTPSAQYWNLVFVALNHIDALVLNDARLRTLISIETNIAQLFKTPHEFQPTVNDLANILSLCISQDNEISQHIREQMNVGEDLLSDTQLQVFSRHLYGPDYNTVHSVSHLITEEMTQIRNDIEYNYQNMSEEKTQELKTKLIDLAHVFKVLNLNEAYVELKQQADLLSQQNILQDQNYAQQLMNSILSAMNSIGILERNYTSSRLQLRVNNMHISLDRLDEAHQALLAESKTLIDLSTQTLVQFIQESETTNLEFIPSQLREISGALLFLGQKNGQQALLQSADYLQKTLEQGIQPNHVQINLLLDVLASADMMIENLQSKQPVLQAMFDVALASSQKLAATA